MCTALVFIDDATSRLMQILLNGTESTFGYFEAARRYIEQHGKPLAFYSDKASIFPRSPKYREKLTTRIGRCARMRIWI